MNWKFWQRKQEIVIDIKELAEALEKHYQDSGEVDEDDAVLIGGAEIPKKQVEKVLDEWRDAYIIN